MKRLLCVIALLTVVLASVGKTTYIPTYYSYIHIKHDNDTISETSQLASLEVAGLSNNFSVEVIHEEVTREKVKAIKRAKAAAGWSMFSAILSTVLPGNRGSLFSRIQDVRQSVLLTKMDADNAKAEQVLSVEIWIDNSGGEELIVNDLARGLTWYVQPHQSIQFEVSNPDMAQLRISNINSSKVDFVTVGAGSSVRKEYISYEDDECWIAKIYRKIGDDYDMSHEPIAYSWISKKTYEAKVISVDDYRQFMKKK